MFHFCNRISGFVKYLDGLHSKTFKDEPKGWEIRYCRCCLRWEELYKLLEFVKRWAASSKYCTMTWKHDVISTRGLPAHVLQEMASYVVFVMSACECGDAYSEAKSISELCVANQVPSPCFQLLNPPYVGFMT